MRLPDRVTGLFLVGLGSLAAYGGSLLPPVPGQPVGPNVFPIVIGIGLAICGLMIAFGIGHSFEEEEELVPLEPGQEAAVAKRGKFYGLRALLPPAAAPCSTSVSVERLGFILTAGLIVLVDLDRARRAAEAFDPARDPRADRHPSDLLQAAARAAPGRPHSDAVVTRCWRR